jgi:hypothetical protein
MFDDPCCAVKGICRGASHNIILQYQAEWHTNFGEEKAYLSPLGYNRHQLIIFQRSSLEPTRKVIRNEISVNNMTIQSSLPTIPKNMCLLTHNTLLFYSDF